MAIVQGDNKGNILVGGADDDDIFGYGGHDLLLGKGGDDALWGADGDDAMFGGAGADTFFGLGGFDTVSYLIDGNATPGVGVVGYLDGTAGSGDTAAGDKLFGVEQLIGSVDDDWLYGSSGSDRLQGAGGDDHLWGGGGNDWLYAGLGADHLDGSSGYDTVIFTTQGADGVYVDLRDGEAGYYDGLYVTTDIELLGIERVDGTDNDDEFRGSDDLSEQIHGGKGADVVYGSKGADLLDGGEADGAADWLSYLYSASGVTVDLANNAASGGHAQGDQISGFENVQGSAHADVIKGNGEANTLDADEGKDTITGRGGADTFQFWYDESGVGAGKRDVVTDFKQAQGDKVDLSFFDPSLEFVGKAAFDGEDQVRYVQKGGFTLLQFEYDSASAGHEMEIQLTGEITFKAADFILA